MTCTSSCSESYSISLPACPEEIEINADLPADTEFTYDFVDQLGNHYRGALTTNGNSQGVIDTSTLPAGLFIPEQGEFLLCIYDSDGEKVDLTFEAKQYTSVLISFYNLEGEASAIIQ